MNTSTDLIDSRLRPALPGLLLAVLTLLFGFGFGIGFGLNEDAIKSHLRSSADTVSETVYQGDEAEIERIQAKSWLYLKRAHLHAGAMGAVAIGLIVVIALLGVCSCITRATSLALGIGGFGYSAFWMWAGLRAPGMGDTGLAKESLKWLAMPTSGAFVVATAVVALAIFMTMVRRPCRSA